jgi:hypothetical protein
MKGRAAHLYPAPRRGVFRPIRTIGANGISALNGHSLTESTMRTGTSLAPPGMFPTLTGEPDESQHGL